MKNKILLIGVVVMLPFEQPERYPKIEHDEVRLVCWLAIQSEPETS